MNNIPRSPALAHTNNPQHQRMQYSNNNQKPRETNDLFCRHRDNIFTFSMSKYRFIIGSRTHARHTGLPGRYHRRTSFHCRFSVVEQQERDQQQQQLQSQLRQPKFAMNVVHVIYCINCS